jgi:transcriptional regulator CtsR
MPRLSDLIEEFIKHLFEQADEDILEIQRNELATYFGCAPSQINYVLMTRFTMDKGYYIESRRGGGGSIKITRVSFDTNEYLNNLISQKIGQSITQRGAELYISSFLEQKLISERESAIMRAAVNDKSINVQTGYKDAVRANILKSMLMVLINL